MDSKPKGLLIDITRCIGCRACVAACKSAHGFPGDDSDSELSATAHTALVERGDLYVRRICMHCVTPSCVSVCPVAALQKTAAGPVVYDAGRCLGCRYCMLACPFNVPRYEWRATVPSVRKCDLCAERLARGEPTACAEACPAGATIAGERDALLAEARRRLRDFPDQYFPHIYGENDVGGTSVLILAPVSFAALGLPTGLGSAPLPDLTMQALGKIPAVVTVGGATLLAIHWITHRREEVARSLAADQPNRRQRPATGSEADCDDDQD